MPGTGDGEDKGQKWKQAHQVSGTERRLLYLDWTALRPGPGFRSLHSTLKAMEALRPSLGGVLPAHRGQQLLWERAWGGGRGGGRETPVVVQERPCWLGTQEGERSRCVPKNDFEAESTGQALDWMLGEEEIRRSGWCNWAEGGAFVKWEH